MLYLTPAEHQKLQTLEESLWRRHTRFDQNYMESILAPDFYEFGRSGKTYSRSDSLAAPYQNINAMLPLRDFNVHLLTEETALITYISEVRYEELEIANRSSIWTRQENGQWQLRFHQGTPVSD